MTDVSVSYEEMKNSANRLNTGKTDIEAKLRELDNMIKQLQNGAFKTQTASPKFQEAYARWNTSAGNTINALNDMSTFLTKAVSSHQDLDNQLTASLQQQQ